MKNSTYAFLIPFVLWATKPLPVSGEELTFFACSDTHYRMDTLAANHEAVQAMNRIAGTRRPESAGTGTVSTPRGVIHCGDATNDAREWQWEAFCSGYKVNGTGPLQ